jgi:putative oxidoreductase
MQRYLGKYEPYIYAALRIVAGLLFACHGAQKVLGLFGGAHGTTGAAAAVGTLPWISGIIELVAGGLIALGLFTGWAAFLASGEMAFAYFMVHAGKGALPILNQGELAVLYCFLFLAMAARGDGPLSVGRALKLR